MSRMHDDLDVTLRVLKRVSSPAHTYRSRNQLAKRERVSDDKLTRALARAADLAGGELVETRDNRIVPTTLGCEFRELIERLLALGKSLAEPVEVLKVVVTPTADSEALASAVGEFGREWGGVVGLQLSVVAEGVREAVEAGTAAFGVTGAGSEPVEPDERIDLLRPLCVLVPRGHRLSGCDVIDTDHFSADRVFLPPRVAEQIDELLSRVPPVNRFEIACPDTLRRLVTYGHGLGFEFAHPRHTSGDAFTRVPVPCVEPLALGLVLPRKRDRLTDPARYFLDVLRRSRECVLPSVPALGASNTPEASLA